jgi:hypothetical protein
MDTTSKSSPGTSETMALPIKTIKTRNLPASSNHDYVHADITKKLARQITEMTFHWFPWVLSRSAEVITD